MQVISDVVNEFDDKNTNALRRIWFVGDVHGHFKYLEAALKSASDRPRWIIFAGDIDIDTVPLKRALEPIWKIDSSIKIGYIHGNHDADTYENWEMLHDAGDAIDLHQQVLDMDGVLVAGLGGHFVGKVWYPPKEIQYQNRKEAMGGGAYRYRNGQRPSPRYLAAIYPEEVKALSKKRADVLVTHEAPSCHPHGFLVLDDLARKLKVLRSFHGHHHDDLTVEYSAHRDRIGFDAVGLRLCQIKNGLAEEIFKGILSRERQ